MIADYLCKLVSTIEINGGAKVSILKRHDGVYIVELILRRAKLSGKARWRTEYTHNELSIKAANELASEMSGLFISRMCLACCKKLSDIECGPLCSCCSS